MGAFLQQVFNLLTTDTGNLMYQLILGFSILGALPGAFSATHKSWAKRLGLGLALLLVFRLVLFLGAGLAWQGVINAGVFLPPLDRTITLLSLVVIIWLWVFPEPNRTADAAALLLGLLAATISALGIVWWSNQGPNLPFNGSSIEWVAELAAIVLSGLGMLLLLVRRPAGWIFGFSLFALMLTGHLAQIFLPASGDYPGAVRMAQMAAYPLLLLLPLRFSASDSPIRVTPASTNSAQPVAQISGKGKAPAQDIQAFHLGLNLASAGGQEEFCRTFTKSLAQAMSADVCLWTSPFGEDDPKIEIICGYDLTREQAIAPISIESRRLPVLGASLRHGRPLRLPANSTSPDLAGLVSVLGLAKSGYLLAAPFQSTAGEFLGAVILLSPYSERSWSAEDQARLSGLSEPMARFLQRNQQIELLENELNQVRLAAEETQRQATQVQSERQKILDDLGQAQKNAHQDRKQLESLAAMVAVQQDAQEIIARLQAENENLKTALKVAQAGIKTNGREPAIGTFRQQEYDHLEKELRSSLEEVALLRTALLEADQKFLTLKAPAAARPSTPEQVEAITAIAQELRQPLAAIVGYTDFLLSESIGILGALQRKFLERIKGGTQRLGRLIDDLLLAISPESNPAQLQVEPISLSPIIDEAIAKTSTQLREKNIILRVDLPQELPALHADREALQKILENLLQNAGTVTPPEGDILLRARIENSESGQDYVMLQIADGGEGIAPEDLANTFSPRRSFSFTAGNQETQSDLSIVKALVDVLGGRIWVDSEPGEGSVYSILFPVSESPVSGRQQGSLV